MVESLTSARDRFRMFRRHEFSLLLAILAVVAITSLLDSQHNYVRDPWTSLVDITRQTTLLGIFSLGAAIVIIAGGIDLSSGSVICFSGTICATLLLMLAPEQMQSRGAEPLGAGVIALSIAGTLIVGCLIGSLHAWLITVVGLPPFVATLATLVGLRSFARAICENVTASVSGGASTQIYVFDDQFRYLSTSVWIPAVVFISLALFCWLLMARTVLGRHLYALGGNEEAARLSGIRTDRMKWFAYCASAVLSSIAGILKVGEVSVAEPHTLGLGSELNAIAAAVIGGCSLQGGLGTMPGTVLGALFLRTVIDGVSKIIKTGADVYEGLIVGVVVVFAVAFSQTDAQRGRTRFFAGGLGLVTMLNLSILAGAIAALVGPRVSSMNTSLDAGPLAGLAFVVTMLLLLLVRSNQRLRNKRLLGLALLVAVPFAAAAMEYAIPKYRLHAATSLVESFGGHIDNADEGFRITLTDAEVDDDALSGLVRKLEKLPRIALLSLAGTAITDDGVAALERLEGLQRLDISRTQVTSSGTARLTRINRELEILH